MRTKYRFVLAIAVICIGTVLFNPCTYAESHWDVVYVVEEYGIVSRYDTTFSSKIEVTIPDAARLTDLGCSTLSPDGRRLFIGKVIQERCGRHPVETLRCSRTDICRESPIEFPKHKEKEIGYFPMLLLAVSDTVCLVWDESFDTYVDGKFSPFSIFKVDTATRTVRELPGFWLSSPDRCFLSPSDSRLLTVERLQGASAHQLQLSDYMHDKHLLVVEFPKISPAMWKQSIDSKGLEGLDVNWEQQIVDLWLSGKDAPRRIEQRLRVDLKTGKISEIKDLSTWPESVCLSDKRLKDVRIRFGGLWGSPYGTREALLSSKQAALLWQTIERGCLDVFPQPIHMLYYSPDDKYLLVVSGMPKDKKVVNENSPGNLVSVMELSTKKIVKTWETETSVAGVVFGPLPKEEASTPKKDK